MEHLQAERGVGRLQRPPGPEPPAQAPWANHTQYADRIAQIVYDTEPKAPKAVKKNLTDTTWEHLLKVAPGCQSSSRV